MLTTFEIIAEPNRRKILDRLRETNLAVNELVHELGMAQPAVSKHLRVLREAGLVQAEVRAQQRLYRLCANPLQELDAWVAPYRQHWDQLQAAQAAAAAQAQSEVFEGPTALVEHRSVEA